MLDEPSLGLAPLVVQSIFAIIERINREQGVAMLLVEQNARVALGVADYGYIMENGRIVINGPRDVLLRDPDVQRFYLGYALSWLSQIRPENLRNRLLNLMSQAARIRQTSPGNLQLTGRDHKSGS